MTAPATFLTELAHALAASTLYTAGHPARERAIDGAFGALVSLLAQMRRPAFTLLGEDVVCGSRPLRELQGWDWAARLADAGVQRLEFEDDVTRDEFEGFIEDVLRRLSIAAGDSADARAHGAGRIRFGAVGVRGELAAVPTPVASVLNALGAEADAVRWLQDKARSDRFLRLSEAEAVVSSLAVALNDEQTMLPLLRLSGFDQFTTYHALNVSTLTMAFTQHLGLPRSAVRSFGVAALLHDMGKMRIPLEILNKATRLNDEEMRVVQRHPVDGARMILCSGDAPDIAPVVAYEHHINYDGSGYPECRVGPRCHFASRLVHLCDVYDALRSPRPYREAWPAQRVLSYIETRTGSEFDPELARGFLSMMSRLEEAPAVLDCEDPALAALV